MGQPIIRGIHAVGAVDIYYRYNNKETSGSGNQQQTRYPLKIPSGLFKIDEQKNGGNTSAATDLDTTQSGIPIAGFRLDGEFLRANPQLASSFVVPVLGGGGVAIVNNNRSGSLTFNCTKVSAPNAEGGSATVDAIRMYADSTSGIGPMFQGTDGAENTNGAVYDMVLIAQLQQAQVGGDSVGATIDIQFSFNGIKCSIMFEGCTVASVDPLGLSGNDAPNYNVVFNYLNWRCRYTKNGTLTPCSFA